MDDRRAHSESTHHVVNSGVSERIANEDSFERQELALLCGPTVALRKTMSHFNL